MLFSRIMTHLRFHLLIHTYVSNALHPSQDDTHYYLSIFGETQLILG